MTAGPFFIAGVNINTPPPRNVGVVFLEEHYDDINRPYMAMWVREFSEATKFTEYQYAMDLATRASKLGYCVSVFTVENMEAMIDVFTKEGAGQVLARQMLATMLNDKLRGASRDDTDP